MNKNLVIIGASGHGKVVADIAQKVGYNNIIFLDDNDSICECGKYPIVGDCKCAKEYLNCDFIVAIGNAKIRERISNDLEELGAKIVTLVHPNAVIADDVELGYGTVVMAGVVINPNVRIGKGCIVNTSSSIDHDCVIKDYVHVSIGSHIAGNVLVGSYSWIGAGATVSNNVEITSNCMIGAGAVVVNNLEEPETYIGVPARKMMST